MKKEIVYIDDPNLFERLLEWYLEALDRFEKEYGEINTDESMNSDAENGVAYITTRDNRKFKLYYAIRNDHLKYYKKCYVVSKLE